MNRKRLSVK